MFAACDRRPRSPIMTVSGIAAEGLSSNLFSCWIAAESVSPRFVAVLGADTELHFDMIPVIKERFWPAVIRDMKSERILRIRVGGQIVPQKAALISGKG